MADTGKIASAIQSKLMADTGAGGVLTLMPDGVWFGVAPPNKTKFVIISLASSHDELQFGSRAFEELVYLVKAVEQSTSMTNVKAAAARIDALLNFQPLTATGYGNVMPSRSEYVEYPEVDEINPDINWQHCGGLYEVFAA